MDEPMPDQELAAGCIKGHWIEREDLCDCCGARLFPYPVWRCEEYEKGTEGAKTRAHLDMLRRMRERLGG